MQYSVVRYNEVLNSSYRFDSEYWVADVINYNKQFRTLSDLNIKVVSGPFGSSLKSEAYCNSGVPFVRISDLNNFFISKDNLIHISEEDHKRLSSSRLKYNDLILSKVGNTIGVVSILTPEIGDECNISENNLGIRLWNNDLKINPYFLLSYLNCKIGQKQILRLISGNAQPKLNVADIKNLKLPIILDLFQLQIEELVKNSYKISNSSKSLYTEAENLLLEEFGLKDWKPKHQLSYIKNYSDTQKAERIDAEYFQPQYDAIIEKIKLYNQKQGIKKEVILDDVVKWSKGVEVGSEQYLDEGFDFIRISDFSSKGVSIASKKISIELFAELKGKYSPRKGDILFTKDGTIGLTYLVDQDQNSIVSGAFLKLRPKIDIESEYLTLVLNSVICKKQIEMMSGGAIIAHLKPSDAMKLQIPILRSEKQKEISLNIVDAKEKDNQSKSLLEIAKKAVEMAIEASEEQASKWIDQELEKLGVQLSSE